jgi:hypothetical protein
LDDWGGGMRLDYRRVSATLKYFGRSSLKVFVLHYISEIQRDFFRSALVGSRTKEDTKDVF